MEADGHAELHILLCRGATLGGYIENLLFGFLSVGLQIVQKKNTERKPTAMNFSTVSLVWVNIGVVWTILKPKFSQLF